ncbi:MAG: (d)CMP kinase [Armatimonadetes bacterium]|nr:(d)CMP kinase [Armatimonadota bacterium]
MSQASAEDRELRIAIDGPAGAGKSTLARELARELGYIYVDTGAMYRAVAYKALQAGLDVQEEADRKRIAEIAAQMEFQFEWQDDQFRLLVDGEDVTEAVRSPEVERLSSPVSAIPEVRQELVAAQKALAQVEGVVMEGRDIGTVVMPDADLKIFLVASPEERARRRWRQQRERGISRPYEAVLAETIERDRRDSTRAINPLKPAEDAVLLDDTHLSRREMLARALELVEEVRRKRGR